MSLPELLRTGSLEAVEADGNAAWAWLDVAEAHLASVELVLSSDPVLAYQAVYEAARKAVVAHMAASGYRATNQRGAHKTVAAYAATVLPDGLGASFDDMRRRRHGVQYRGSPVGEREIERDLAQARAIVALVRAGLAADPR